MPGTIRTLPPTSGRGDVPYVSPQPGPPVTAGPAYSAVYRRRTQEVGSVTSKVAACDLTRGASASTAAS
jgi:hypothetical protein